MSSLAVSAHTQRTLHTKNAVHEHLCVSVNIMQKQQHESLHTVGRKFLERAATICHLLLPLMLREFQRIEKTFGPPEREDNGSTRRTERMQITHCIPH